MIQLDEFELWRDRGEDAPLIIRGEARLPEKAAGTVVICHGFKGFAHFSFFPYLAEKLAEAGFRAITFDFSGSGVGEDRETFTNRDAFTHNTYLQELDDLEAVIAEAKVRDWIRKNPGAAVKLARQHAAAFDKSHSVAGATKRSASKTPTR